MFGLILKSLLPLTGGLLFSIFIKEKSVLKSLSYALFWILVPLLIFFGVLKSDVPVLLGRAFAGFLFLIAYGFIASKLIRSSPFTKKQSFLLSCYLNIGWFGLPVSLLIYGQEAFEFVLAFYLAGSLIGSTIAIFVVLEDSSSLRSSKAILKAPFIYAFILGLLVNLFFKNDFFELGIIDYISDLKTKLSSIVLVLSMFIVGGSAINPSDISMNQVLINIKFYIQRVVFGVLLSLIVSSLVGFESIRYLILISMLPSAANIVVLYQQYNLPNSNLSFQVLISTIVSVFLCCLL